MSNLRAAEYRRKLTCLRELMSRQEWEWVLLQSPGSFAWLSGGGRSFIVAGDPRGVGFLLVSQASVHLLAANIEIPRLPDEELAGLDLTVEAVPWPEFFADPLPAVRAIAGGAVLASDLPLPGAVDGSSQLRELRSLLGTGDVARYRLLGRDTALAVEQTAREVEPGESEFSAAARLQAKLNRSGIVAPVLLVASDRRIWTHRHPLPTGKLIERYLMLVACALRDGLWCSITRLAHFGKPDPDLSARAAACAQVDSAYIAASVPGNTVEQAFAAGRAAYAAQGYPEEWRLHHQGGPAGYGSREFFAGTGPDLHIQFGHSFAWNPSIAGVKSEDTVIVTESPDGAPRSEVITETGDWPQLSGSRQALPRPAILLR